MIYYSNQIALFRSASPFAELSESDAKWFLKCMDAEFAELHDGDVIWQGGEKSEFATFILKGTTDKQLPPMSGWQQIESDSGLSHSIVALVAPETQKAAGDCTVVRLKIMRLLKPCNFQCSFHVDILEKIS